MKKWLIIGMALAAVAPRIAVSQEAERAATIEAATEDVKVPQEAEAEAASPFSLTLAFDFPSQYFGRGIWAENQNVTLQPAVDMSLMVYETDSGALNSISLLAGTFHSFQWGPTGKEGAADDPWYEADFYGGVSVGLFDFLELSIAYYKYTSPNDGFKDIDELDFGIGIDDSKFWSDTVGVDIDGFDGFHPTITIARELNN